LEKNDWEFLDKINDKINDKKTIYNDNYTRNRLLNVSKDTKILVQNNVACELTPLDIKNVPETPGVVNKVVPTPE
jgi:hypothetical protein